MSESELTFLEYCRNSGVKEIRQDTLVLEKKIKSKAVIYTSYPETNTIGYTLMDNLDSHTEYCNDGQKQIIKLLRQGKYLIVATLDLHNYKQSETVARLEEFIENAYTPGNSCVKIIHGKGLNSPENKAVLKIIVRRFLERHCRLLAYTKAGDNNGGDGATLIKLKN